MQITKATLTIRLPEDIGARLDKLTQRSGRTKSCLAREAILEHIEDLEDIHLTQERLKTQERTWTMEEAKKGA